MICCVCCGFKIRWFCFINWTKSISVIKVGQAWLEKMAEVKEMASDGVTQVVRWSSIIIITNMFQVSSYYTYLLSLGDRRVESWPLMASPIPTAALTLAYLLVRLRQYLTDSHFMIRSLKSSTYPLFSSSAALGLALCLVANPSLWDP